jgi:aldehyde dehydrogenase (NAD+)
MSNESLTGALLNIRRYYDTGATRLYSFRQRQLLTFKQTILKYETEINQALYEDLKKTPEEVWTTETGLLLQDISHILKHLKQWMQPAVKYPPLKGKLKLLKWMVG